MKKFVLSIFVVLTLFMSANAQNNLIVGAGGGLVYGVNESPKRDLNGAIRFNAVLTNAFGSFLSPELGVNFLSLSSKESSVFKTSIANIDLGLRWYFIELGDFKPYIYGGIGVGSFNSKYNYWHSEFITKDGADLDKANGTAYGNPNETVLRGENYNEMRTDILSKAGGRDAFYVNGDRTSLDGASKGTVLLIPIGGGVTYQVSRDFNVNLAIYNYFTSSDEINPYADGVKDAFWSGLLTINYNFGNIFGDNNDEEDTPFPNFIMGTSLNLETVTFETGSSKLDKESNKILRRAFVTMNDNQTIEVKIEGHTDDVGDSQMNMNLSIERAEVVKKWLVDKGISPSRISASGSGSTKPLLSNDSPVNRAKNRRIDFIRTK